MESNNTSNNKSNNTSNNTPNTDSYENMKSKVMRLEVENNYLKEKNAYLQKLVNTYESQYSLLDLSNNNMKNYSVFQDEFSDISPIFKSIPYVRRMNAFYKDDQEVIF